jgi:hypothetical protein
VLVASASIPAQFSPRGIFFRTSYRGRSSSSSITRSHPISRWWKIKALRSSCAPYRRWLRQVPTEFCYPPTSSPNPTASGSILQPSIPPIRRARSPTLTATTCSGSSSMESSAPTRAQSGGGL